MSLRRIGMEWARESVCIILSVCLVSCNLFETRTPQSPSQTSSNFTPATDPSLVFANLMNSFRDLNSFNYMLCLADSVTSQQGFLFEPTAQARAKYGLFYSWTRQSEQQYFDNAKQSLQSGSTMSLEFLTLVSQSVQSDSAQYDATYRLTIPHNHANVPQVAQGRAVFYLYRSSTWYIRRWVDIAQNQNDFTWSDVKGVFGQ